VSNLPNRRASLRLADRGDLYVPATRLKLGERAFSVAGPLAWNRLPLELRTNFNTASFKRQLKTFVSITNLDYCNASSVIFVEGALEIAIDY
jgi:hypothetical protein